jgi:hypothetical protein
MIPHGPRVFLVRDIIRSLRNVGFRKLDQETERTQSIQDKTLGSRLTMETNLRDPILDELERAGIQST